MKNTLQIFLESEDGVDAINSIEEYKGQLSKLMTLQIDHDSIDASISLSERRMKIHKKEDIIEMKNSSKMSIVKNKFEEVMIKLQNKAYEGDEKEQEKFKIITDYDFLSSPKMALIQLNGILSYIDSILREPVVTDN